MDYYQWTPLHLAAGFGRLNVVKYLVSRNADLNVLTQENDTPLQLATRYAHIKTVNYLLGNGADINVTNPGPFALH